MKNDKNVTKQIKIIYKITLLLIYSDLIMSFNLAVNPIIVHKNNFILIKVGGGATGNTSPTINLSLVHMLTKHPKSFQPTKNHKIPALRIMDPPSIHVFIQRVCSALQSLIYVSEQCMYTVREHTGVKTKHSLDIVNAMISGLYFFPSSGQTLLLHGVTPVCCLCVMVDVIFTSSSCPVN